MSSNEKVISSSSSLIQQQPNADLPIVYTVLEASVAIIAVIGNLLVIVVFLQDRRLRKVTNFYIISLSLADLLVGAIGIPSAILTKIGMPRSSMQLCLTMLSLLIVLCTISILNLVAVSLDRYWAILHPLDYHKRISEKTACLIICACWILGGLIGFLPLFGWRNEYRDSCYFIPTMNYNFLMFLYFVTIVFPAFIMALFYIRIYIVVVQQLSLNKVRHLNMSDSNITARSKYSRSKRSSFQNDESVIKEFESNSNNLHCLSSSDIYLKRQVRSSLSSIRHNINATSQNAENFTKCFRMQTRFLNKFCNNTPLDENSKANSDQQSINTVDQQMTCTKWRSLLNIRRMNDQVFNNTTNDSSRNGIGKLSYSRREVKKAQKLFVIVVFFMICWIPLYTSNAIQAICNDCLVISASLLDYLIILSHINSAGSPFLYAFHMKDFRQALRRLICKGAINPRKLRDLRREELFSVSGQRVHSTVSKDFQNANDQVFNRKKSVTTDNNEMCRHHKIASRLHHSYHTSIDGIPRKFGSIHNCMTLGSQNNKKRSTYNNDNKLQMNHKYFTVPMRNKTKVMVDVDTLKTWK